MSKIRDEKSRLRAYFRRALEAVPLEELAALSRRIHAYVCAIPEVVSAQGILAHVASPREAQTMPLFEQWLAEGKRIFVPYFADRTSPMTWCVLSDPELLVPGPFGILQLKDATPEAPPPHAPVLVPGLAFTRSGNRLGRGGGHYDRFLSKHRGFSIGLAIGAMLAEELPVEPHDVPVDTVVTDHGIFRHSPGKTAGKN